MHGIRRLEEARALLEKLPAPGIQDPVDLLGLARQAEGFQVLPQRCFKRQICSAVQQKPVSTAGQILCVSATSNTHTVRVFWEHDAAASSGCIL